MIILCDIFSRPLCKMSFSQLIYAGFTIDEIENGISGHIIHGYKMRPTEKLLKYLELMECAPITKYRAIEKFKGLLWEKLKS